MGHVLILKYWRFFVTLGLLLCCGHLGSAFAIYDLKDNAIQHAQNGQLLMERGQVPEAIDEFKAALRLNPYTNLSAALYNNLGMAYKALGNYPYAFASFQRAIRLDSSFSLYHQNLIEAYADAGNIHTIETMLRELVRKNPDNAEAWFLLALLYRETGKRHDARDSFAHYLMLEPESEKSRAAKTLYNTLSP